jgi:hypothetical protein
VRLDHLLSMETDRPLTTAPLSLCDFLVVHFRTTEQVTAWFFDILGKMEEEAKEIWNGTVRDRYGDVACRAVSGRS